MAIWNNPLFISKKERFLNLRMPLFLALALLSNLIMLFMLWVDKDQTSMKLVGLAQLVSFMLYAIPIYTLFIYPQILNKESFRFLSLPRMHHQKYEKTGLSDAFSLELKEKLEDLMTNQKLYLKHELRLDDIAELLNISRHHASQVINENFNMNFYDFVNAYRIEEAKKILLSGFESNSDSISDLAYQCGFNNRVSFYKAFKKITQTTPTEFMNKAV
jgi:Response regulator containing CheY-like receiver domain and AraC-type DNA-binding domain